MKHGLCGTCAYWARDASNWLDNHHPNCPERPMSVRAKFKVEQVTRTVSWAEVKLQPVTSGSDENKQFYRWTPGGSIHLATINPEAAAQFEPGKEFYIDFTPADAPAAA